MTLERGQIMNDKIRESAMLHQSLILHPYDKIINMNGYEAICTFAEEFGGGSIYVPSLRTIFKHCIEKEILNRYNGKNIRSLAKEYKFSERNIRNMIQS